jgi:hypothetical protein
VRPARALLVLLAVAGGAAVAGWQLWPEPPPDGAARDRGTALAAALRAGSEATASIRAPHRCARLYSNELGPDVAAVAVDAPGMRVVRRRGPILEVEPAAGTSLTIGIVADARGAVESLPGIHRAFRRAGVGLVISLGGMGVDRDVIGRALAALAAEEHGAADGAAWPVLAMPGDWESVPEHRAAVAALADRGVLDGSEIRLLDVGWLHLATLPGAPHASRLMSGSDGCVFTVEDATAIATLLAGRPGVRLLLVHAPPRQGNAGLASLRASPTDTGHTAIALGERSLADVLRATPVDAVIHGLLATRHSAGGEHPVGASGPVILGTGSLDPLQGAALAVLGELANDAPRGPTALVAKVTSERITWHPVTPDDPAH